MIDNRKIYVSSKTLIRKKEIILCLNEKKIKK